MDASLLATFVAATKVLYSRVRSSNQVIDVFQRYAIDVKDRDTYTAPVLWFFQFVSRLDSEQLGLRLSELDRDDPLEARVLANEAVQLSARVVEKHRWLNRAFILMALTLSSLLLAGASYVVRLGQTV